MASTINFTIRLGPLVTLELAGDNCNEISEALNGFETLNQQINSMCSELAESIYPQDTDSGGKKRAEARK